MTDLLAASENDRRKHVAAIQQRLDELNQQLRISLPVYLMFTKADLIAGFSEFFDDLAQEGRAQVWGTTFPIEAVARRLRAAALRDRASMSWSNDSIHAR